MCDLEIGGEEPDWKPNPEAFVPRAGLGRRTKEIANAQIRNILSQEVEDNENDI